MRSAKLVLPMCLLAAMLVSSGIYQPPFRLSDTSHTTSLPSHVGILPPGISPDVRHITAEQQNQIVQAALNNLWKYRSTTTADPVEPRQVQAQNGQIAYVGVDGHLYFMNPDGTARRLIVGDLNNVAWPSWSPDSQSLAFTADGDHGRCLFRFHVGQSYTELICGFASIDSVARWSPQGARLAVLGRQTANSGYRTWMVEAGGGVPIEIGPTLDQQWWGTWLNEQMLVVPGESPANIFRLYKIDVNQPTVATPITPDYKCSDPCTCNDSDVWLAYPDISPTGEQIAFLGGRTEGDKSSCTAYYAVYLVDPAGAGTPHEIVDVANTSSGTAMSAGPVRWSADNQHIGLLATGSDSKLRLNIIDAVNNALNVLSGREAGSWSDFNWSPDANLLAAGYVPTDQSPVEIDKVDPAVPGVFGFVQLAEGRNPAWGTLPAVPTTSVDLEATGLEVTQAVQRLNEPYIPLIAGKTTWVRVYLRSTVSEISGVTARLQLTRESEQKWINPVNQSITARLNGSSRDFVTHTLNFMLPADWLNGTIGVRAQINPHRLILESNYSNNFYPLEAQVPQSLVFTSTQTIDVRSYQFRFIGSSTTYDVPDGQPADSVEWANRVYPMADDSMHLVTPNQELITLDWALGGKYDLMSEQGWINAVHQVAQRCTSGFCYGWVSPDLPHGFWGYANEGSAAGLSNRANIAAHEIGHVYGRVHAPGCGAAWPDWNFPNGGLIGNSTEYGFGGNEDQPQVYRPAEHYDFMSYCGLDTQWVSPHTYSGLFARLKTDQTNAPRRTLPLTQTMATIAGTIGSDDVVSFFPMYQRDGVSGYTDLIGEGDYILQLEDKYGAVLFTRFFTPTSESPGFTSSLIYFNQVLPWSSGATRASLWHNSALLGAITATTSIPQISIETPLSGTQMTDSTLVQWTATDNDDDVLNYLVEYSADGGVTWSVLAADLTDSSLILDSNRLQGTALGQIRVTASDGFNSGVAISDGFFLINDHSPDVSIRAPQTGLRLRSGLVLNLRGYAYDREDGVLTGSALVWDLENGTILGTGNQISVDHLSQGPHSISLTATDIHGHSSSTSVNITITDYPFVTYLPLTTKNYHVMYRIWLPAVRK